MPPFVYRTPVRFADVDHAGIVYYPVFFHYFHLAFEEFFIDRLGARSYVDLLDDDRIGFPSVSAQCDFKQALGFGDTAEIEMTVDRIGDRSVTFRYRIYRAADERNADRVLAAEGTNTCAVVDLSKFRAIVAPDRLRGLFEELRADPGQG
jgi:4-hydroxybenzoyl-CoA thioesterase